MTLISGIISIFISLAIIRKFKINYDTTANLEKSESVAFACGCAIALSLTFTYLTVDYFFGAFPNFAAIIPAWVLALMIMHGLYFSIEIFVHKLKITYAEIFSQ